jgi:transposase
MQTAYSADMRKRVIAWVEAGGSRRETAEHFEVSPSTTIIWSSAFARPAGVRTSRGAGTHRRWRSMPRFCWR